MKLPEFFSAPADIDGITPFGGGSFHNWGGNSYPTLAAALTAVCQEWLVDGPQPGDTAESLTAELLRDGVLDTPEGEAVVTLKTSNLVAAMEAAIRGGVGEE